MGTVTDAGRCSSHPKRAPPSRRPSSPSTATSTATTLIRRDTDTSLGPYPLSPLSILPDAEMNQQQFLSLNADWIVSVPVYEAESVGLRDMLPSLMRRSTVSKFSILALCLCHSGLIHGHEGLVQESIGMHLKAIQAMKRALVDARLSHRMETLAASIFMSDYEVSAILWLGTRGSICSY